MVVFATSEGKEISSGTNTALLLSFLKDGMCVLPRSRLFFFFDVSEEGVA